MFAKFQPKITLVSAFRQPPAPNLSVHCQSVTMDWTECYGRTT